MGEALYRKYRSKSLDEVVGQDHVTKTLANALKGGKISHAYLLAGPKGVGKTSIARILAHEVNNLPYSDNQHLDIIEIDAASNRRIDEIRDIREKVRISPTSAKYKVYIIDEVHMLTKEAFNALLKTLEEPPSHAIFILATTEAHKLPETIVSRTQRFNLKPIDAKVIVRHLELLAKKEKVKVEKLALELIAQHSRGSLRDAISLFDQLSSHSADIKVADVEHILGIAPEESIANLARSLFNAPPTELTTLLLNLEEQGVHAPTLAHQLSEYLQRQIINDSLDPQVTLPLLKELLDVQSAADPARSLELILLGFNLTQRHNQITSKATATKNSLGTKVVKEVSVNTNSITASASKAKSSDKIASNDALMQLVAQEQWQKILEAVRQRHNTLYGVVRMAQPKVEGGNLVLDFQFPFHEKRMNDSKNRQLIQEVIADKTGINVSIVCISKKVASIQRQEPVAAKDVKQVKQDSVTLSTITDIFGGGEILES